MAREALYIQKNVGPKDRILRVILGTAFMTFSANTRHRPVWKNMILAALGGSQVVEGITGY